MMDAVFPMMALNRLRMATDGWGVTTLVFARGCPLRCRYCINPQSWREDTPVKQVSARELYELTRVDDLYFQATGGGITFGGGEPLVHTDFIEQFSALCRDKWRLTAETSLFISESDLSRAVQCIDEFIVDIKDMNPDIYRHYTGRDNDILRNNLRFLIAEAGPQRILARVPRIPGYNHRGDVEHSVAVLRAMGIVRFDVFDYIIRSEMNAKPQTCQRTDG